MLLDTLPHEILAHYPAILRGTLTFLANHGGFSGAQLWRLDTPSGSYCLKAWPTDGRSVDELKWIHALMARASALAWMPRVMQTSAGTTFVTHQGRLWELVTWMPGKADFLQRPSEARLTAACTALAELHRAWAPVDTKYDVCPAILRRRDSWQAWQHLLHSGWRPTWQPSDPYASIAEQLWQRVLECLAEVPPLLTLWSQRPVAIQPCACDLWHDHVLFTHDTVAGLIDFGSAKEDHVAVDLARMLGSMIGAEVNSWELGLDTYSRIRPLSAEERALARALDKTGTILAATHWLRWLYHERRVYEHPATVVGRLTVLLQRLMR
jgi:Ser/Thr protein kinase RdoA (MazF antagonist)